MKGLNPIRKQERHDGQTLWVQDVWGTIQGEGPLSGTPAVFVRLAGCNLACHFCDTEFESSTWRPSVAELLDRIHDVLASGHTTDLVVLTGGEPFRQNFGPLVEALNTSGFRVQVETAGTLWFSREWPGHPPRFARAPGLSENSIVVSPKTPVIRAEVAEAAWAWKYVIRVGEVGADGLPNYSTQQRGKFLAQFSHRDGLARPSHYERVLGPWVNFQRSRIFLQPCDEGPGNEAQTEANTRLAVELCQRHGYRLSIQTHKALGLQ